MMIRAADPEEQALCAQLGVNYAITKCAPELTGMKDPSDYESLKIIRDRFADRGIRLYGLEGDEFDMSRIKLGLPGRDEDLEKYCAMLENMGKLGLELLCYNFMAGVGWYRSDVQVPERGGAVTCSFDAGQVPKKEPVMTHEQLWDNYRYFLSAVLPAAERAGVRLGLHPDDPPVPELMGYPRIFTSTAAYEKALALSHSPYHGVTFCQATFRMMGENVEEVMAKWGSRIAFLHIRDAKGSAARFRETFHDNGPTDMPLLLETAARYQPDCVIRPDHTPAMAGEGDSNNGYHMKGNLFAIGYVRGICEAKKIPLE